MQRHRIVVAGGAGFIGTHLCNRLLSEDNDVVCIDNLYSGRLENIQQFLGDPHFCFVNHDVTKPFNLTDVSMVFNLACPASPKFYQKDAIFTTKTAFIGTVNMLDLATKNNCPMLQASTSEVYGEPLIHPQPESYYGNVNPVGIRSCYDEGKRCAESLCMDYHRQYGINVKIVRIFNTYGPYMRPDDGRVISNFIMQALRGDPITIYGDGNQTRSFMYIDDLIEGFMKVMNTPNDFTGPVNLGNPEEHTIKEIAEIIIAKTKSKSLLTYLPLPGNDPTRRKPNMSTASNIWSPKEPIDIGIAKVINYYKSYLALT
ncbi:MAG: SDR family oxidoreductase [Prevotellaceae bacterium]|nr:SDR family oxidoreductase [Prevotellaceae bacterium]